MKDIELSNPEVETRNRASARLLPAVVFGLRAAALAGLVVTAAAGLGGAFDTPVILADGIDPPHPSTCC